MRNLPIHNAVHWLNIKITIALPVVEQHNLKIIIGGRGRSTWFLCACVVQSKHYIAPKVTWHKGNPIFISLQQAYFFVSAVSKLCRRGEDTEMASCALIGSFKASSADELLFQ